MKLKSWTHFFQAIKRGDKTHDLRSKKDRTFYVGQRLTLQEYDQFKGEYTGEEVEVEVTFITDEVTPCAFSSAVLEKGYAILSIQLVNRLRTPITSIPLTQGHSVQIDPSRMLVGGGVPTHFRDGTPVPLVTVNEDAPLTGFETEDDN